MRFPTTHLLRERVYLPLFLTQFFGAFNDNAFKLAMLTVVSYYLSTSQAASEHYQAVAGALFTLPFFLFSATAGQLADKYDKAVLTRLIKFFEIILMVIGSFALYRSNILLMLIVLTGMGIHSTFFGPIKYAILPDHLPRERLLGATALIDASTFLAILLGTILGTLAIGSTKSHVGHAVFITNLLAVGGFIASCFIPSAPSKIDNLNIDWNLVRATREMTKEVMSNPRLYPSILAISWFWLIGAVILTKLPDYVHYELGADTKVFAIFLGLFSIGIGLGALAISLFLAGKITLRYVPISMLLLSLFIVDLYWVSPELGPDAALVTVFQFFSQPTNLRIAFDFLLFSFCGGLFVVPLYTYLQVSSNERSRARTIAANNIVNALFMALGSVFVMVLLYFPITIATVFLILALLNLPVVLGLWGLLRLQSKGGHLRS